MKKILLTFTILLTIVCKAQSPIKSLYDDVFESNSGAYYKDIYNDLNRFVGTWIYTDGTTSLTIMLQKKEMKYNNILGNNFYEDLLVGEYQYIENGIEKINTLPNLQNLSFDVYDHNIIGNIISKPISGVENMCYNCGPNEMKVLTYFSDPERDILGYEPQMIFHHYTENGVEKLRLNFRGGGMLAAGNELTSYNIPFGVYILVKQ